MKIRSFSGAHPLRLQCVLTAMHQERLRAGDAAGDLHDDELLDGALAIIRDIHAHRCPRCTEPLVVSDDGTRFWRNAGSRETRCRCIPICSDCGTHEALEPRFSDSHISICDWPASATQVSADLERWRSGATAMTCAVTAGHLLTDDGVSVLRSDPHTGGWREFGYSDE